MENNTRPQLINLSQITDRRGNLTAIESAGELIPFEIKRVYYLYDVPAGAERGGHSHRSCHEVLIALSGSFDVTIDDGRRHRTITLNRPFQALHIVPGIWRTLQNFASGSVCLVLASEHYDESDYVRRYLSFLKLKREEPAGARVTIGDLT